MPAVNDVGEPCAGEPHGAPSSSGATDDKEVDVM